MKPLYWIMIVVLIGAGAFYGGMQYQKSQRVSFTGGGNMMMRGGPNASGNPMMRGISNGMRPVQGEIISQDDASITVKLQDGSSKIVLISDSTAVNKATKGTRADLMNGEQVFVVGTTNSDGSMSAQNIQVGVQDMRFRGDTVNPEDAVSP